MVTFSEHDRMKKNLNN